jgi:hypothetical protein
MFPAPTLVYRTYLPASTGSPFRTAPAAVLGAFGKY